MKGMRIHYTVLNCCSICVCNKCVFDDVCAHSSVQFGFDVRPFFSNSMIEYFNHECNMIHICIAISQIQIGEKWLCFANITATRAIHFNTAGCAGKHIMKYKANPKIHGKNKFPFDFFLPCLRS